MSDARVTACSEPGARTVPRPAAARAEGEWSAVRSSPAEVMVPRAPGPILPDARVTACSEPGARAAVGRSARWRERGLGVALWTAVGLLAAVFCWLLGDLVARGYGQLGWTFLTEMPREAGRAGGIASILVATALLLAVCLGVALPLGLGTAVLLAECAHSRGAANRNFFPGSDRFARWVRHSLDVLAGVPSVVFGLFGNAFFCVYLGLGYSLLAGGLTLALMVLPFFTRTAEASLRAVPAAYRLGAAALGLPRFSALVRVELPVAVPGLLAGLVLSLGRALAETAALLFTSGYVDRLPTSLLDSGRALSIHIYDLAMNVPGGETQAYATALVLVFLLLVVHVFARLAEVALTRRTP